MKKLNVIYGKQNSFYGKAEYSIVTGPLCIAELKSYGNTVFKLERYGTNKARITIDGQGRYSKTTYRHIKEFKSQLDHGNFGEYFELMYKEAMEDMNMKQVQQKIKNMVEENSEVAFTFNIDDDGYEVSEATRKTFESYGVEVNEENLVYLAKLLMENN